MKVIPIKFCGAGHQIDVTEQGESNTVVLACVLPADFDGVEQGEIALLIGNGKTPRSYPFPSAENPNIWLENGKLCIRLWAELTAKRFLRLQIKGFAADGSVPVTPYSPLLRFAASVGSSAPGALPPDTIQDLIAAKHTHPNKPILDEITELPQNTQPLTNEELEQLINNALAG